MELHTIKVYKTEFSLLHLTIKNEILVEQDIRFKVGDIIHMIEITESWGKSTGRTLNYRVKGINKDVGLIEGKLVWTLYLKKLVNYNERMKLLIKDMENVKDLED